MICFLTTVASRGSTGKHPNSPTLAVIGVEPEGRTAKRVVLTFTGANSASTEVDAVGNFVRAFGGFAYLRQGAVGAITPAGAKSKFSAPTGPVDAFAVSPDGTLLVAIRGEAQKIVFISLPSGKTAFVTTFAKLRKSGLPVGEALVPDFSVVFDRSGDSVYVALPSRLEPDDGDMTRPCTVSFKKDFKARYVSLGAPIGFIGSHLATYDYGTGKVTVAQEGAFRLSEGQMLCTDGSRVLALKGEPGLARLTFYRWNGHGFDVRRETRKLPKSFLPRKVAMSQANGE